MVVARAFVELPTRSDDWREGFPSGMPLLCLRRGRGDQLPSVASCRNWPKRVQGDYANEQELLSAVRLPLRLILSSNRYGAVCGGDGGGLTGRHGTRAYLPHPHHSCHHGDTTVSRFARSIRDVQQHTNLKSYN